MAIALWLSPIAPLCAEKKAKISPEEHLRQLHIETYGPERDDEQTIGSKDGLNKFTQMVEPTTPPTSRDIAETTHAALPPSPLLENPTMDLSTLKMLELIRGDEKPECHLTDILMGPNATHAARFMCADLLSQPNTAQAHHMRDTIKALVEDDTLFAHYNRAINTWKRTLPSLLFFSESTQELRNNIINDQLFFTWENSGESSAQIATAAFRGCQDPADFVIKLVQHIIMDRIVRTISIRGNKSTTFLQATRWIEHIVPHGLFCVALPTALGAYNIDHFFKGNHRIPTPALIGANAAIPLAAWWFASSARNTSNGHKYLQERMIGVANAMRALRVIRQITSNNPATRNCPLFQPLDELIHRNKKHTHDFYTLQKRLATNSTFTGSASHLSPSGVIRDSYRVMTEVKDEFRDLIRAGATAEVIFNLASHIRKNPERFCLVDFDTNTTKPSFEMRDYWNPFVSYHKDMDDIVTNNVECNTPDNPMRGMIITGPNAGGKSTAMKAMVINMVLAQTFGIAAARECRMTPFTKIMCHLNTSDDTSGGDSGHMAQVKRFKNLIEVIESCKPNEYIVLVLDELFNATSPEQADDLVYKALNKLAQYKNVIFISPTHYPAATKLEKDLNGLCRNYQVLAELNPDGKTVKKYLYKIAPGISPIKNAAQVAESVGITF